MVIDLAACRSSTAPSVRFDTYMVQADETIAFAMTHFTVRPDKTPASEFLSYRARSNGRSKRAPSL
jgi:VirK protein